MAGKPHKFEVLSANRPAESQPRRGRGLLDALKRRGVAKQQRQLKAAPPEVIGAPLGAPEIRIALPKPPLFVEPSPPETVLLPDEPTLDLEDLHAAPEAAPTEEMPGEALAYEDAITEEILAEPIAEAAAAPEAPESPEFLFGLPPPETTTVSPPPREEDLDRLERMLDEYLTDNVNESQLDPHLGMDSQWWSWFETLDEKGSYRFGLSGVWLRWYESLDDAA